MRCWLIDHLIVCLFVWLIDWLIDWSIDEFINEFIDILFRWILVNFIVQFIVQSISFYCNNAQHYFCFEYLIMLERDVQIYEYKDFEIFFLGFLFMDMLRMIQIIQSFNLIYFTACFRTSKKLCYDLSVMPTNFCDEHISMRKACVTAYSKSTQNVRNLWTESILVERTSPWQCHSLTCPKR